MGIEMSSNWNGQFLQKRYTEKYGFNDTNSYLRILEWLNDVQEHKMKLTVESIQMVTTALSTMAPHMCSEILATICHKQLENCAWPVYDPVMVTTTEVHIVVQVNGKVRTTIKVKRGTSKQDVQELAEQAIAKWLADTQEVTVIFVPDRLINFVVKAL